MVRVTVKSQTDIQPSLVLTSAKKAMKLAPPAIYNHWTGLVDWTGGLDWWTDLKNHFYAF